MIEQCITTTEPAYAAKFAFQLAQQFNNFYHKHHILTETDEAKKRFLPTTAAMVHWTLIKSLHLMGIGAAQRDVNPGLRKHMTRTKSLRRRCRAQRDVVYGSGRLPSPSYEQEASLLSP